MSEHERYIKAMVRGDLDACIRIEQRYDLYGYPPEIVSTALAAIDKGESPDDAIDAILAGTKP